MREILVTEFIQATPEQVFAAVSDHALFLAGGGLRCQVVTPGRNDPNGDGAVRVVRSGDLRFVERISAFDPPRGYDYLVIGLSRSGRELPFRHERGWLTLVPVDGGTRVEWRSRFSISVPILAGLIEWFFVRQASKGFTRQLQFAKQRLESP